MSQISKIELEELLARAANRALELSLHYPDNREDVSKYRWRRWDWPVGVSFYGVGKAYDKLHDESYIDRMKTWIDSKIDSIEKVCVNSNALVTTLIRLNERNPKEKYMKLFEVYDAYLMNPASRTESGALEHTVIDRTYARQVWADTIFMSLLYLAHRGVKTGNESYLQELYRQLELHNNLLFDPEVQLYWHGWNDEEKRHIGVHWGRGNAWMTAGIVEILSITPDHYPQRTGIIDVLNKQMAALAPLQDESGLWRTVLNHRDTYLESSVTAGIAYGALKGIRLGYIDSQYESMAWRALAAVAAKVDAEGNATFGSSGTPVKKDALEYNHIPYDLTPFTQGLFLMALSEGLEH